VVINSHQANNLPEIDHKWEAWQYVAVTVVPAVVIFVAIAVVCYAVRMPKTKAALSQTSPILRTSIRSENVEP